MEEKRPNRDLLEKALNEIQNLPPGKWSPDVINLLQRYCPPEIDLADPHFRPIILETIEKLLIVVEETPEENIPQNLDELVAIYETYLAEEEAKIKKTPYWDYYDAVKDFLTREVIPPWQVRILALRVTKKIVEQLPQVAHAQAFEETVSPEEYQTTLQEAIEENLPLETPLPSEKIKDLAEKTRLLAAKLAATPRPTVLVPPPSSLPAPKAFLTPPQASEQERKVIEMAGIPHGIVKLVISSALEEKELNYQQYKNTARKTLEETAKKANLPPVSPQTTEAVVQSSFFFADLARQQTTAAAVQIQDNLPPSVSPEQRKKLTENALKKITPSILSAQLPSSLEISQTLSQSFKQAGIAPPPAEQLKTIGEKIETSIINIFSSPQEEPHGVAWMPAFTLLHPPTTVSAAKKIALTPIVGPLKLAIRITEKTLPEMEAQAQKEGNEVKRGQAIRKISELKESLPALKAMALQGITSNEVRSAIKSLLQAGLPPTHPKIVQLENLEKEIAKIEAAHPTFAAILRPYHEFSKKIESWQNKEPQTGILLQPSVPPPWHQKKGYAWNLRNTLNHLGGFLRTHEWVVDSSGRKVIRFVLPDKIVRLVTLGKFQTLAALKSFAYQKFIQPVLNWLGKRVLGKTIKNFSIKLTSYLAKKGIKEGAKKLISWATAKAILAVIPEPVISKILLALSLIKDFIWGGLKFLIRKFREKPELAIAGGIAMISLPILVPMLPALKFILTTAGIISAGLGFLAKAGSFIAALAGKAGGFISSTASVIGSFFSSLSTISLPSIIPIVGVGGTIGLTTTLTVFTIITARSTFIEPAKTTAPLTENEYLILSKTAEPTRVSEEELPAKITYTIKLSPKKSPLTNINIEDNLKVIPNQTPPRLQLIEPTNLPSIISSETVLKYQTEVPSRLNNSYLINNFKISFTTEDRNTASLETTSIVLVGTPPASDCPLLPGTYNLKCMSYIHPDNPCHGTNSYWSEGSLAREACEGKSVPYCCYSIPYKPIFSGGSICLGPTNPKDPAGDINLCYNLYKETSSLCNEYGYATDLEASPHTAVFLPTVNGRCVKWAYSTHYNSAIGWGYGTAFKVVGSCDGNPLPFNTFEMAFIHLDKEPPTQCSEANPCQSGTTIGGVNPNTLHLHVEVMIDSQFIPPDDICK